jgi:hypothetical protein
MAFVLYLQQEENIASHLHIMDRQYQVLRKTTNENLFK